MLRVFIWLLSAYSHYNVLPMFVLIKFTSMYNNSRVSKSWLEPNIKITLILHCYAYPFVVFFCIMMFYFGLLGGLF